MSLATRCTACGTIFRVVEDQLRVSEGWVRCGRCAEVFDAREQLFDIDLEAPPPWPPVNPDGPAPAAALYPPASAPAAQAEEADLARELEAQFQRQADQQPTWPMARDAAPYHPAERQELDRDELARPQDQDLRLDLRLRLPEGEQDGQTPPPIPFPQTPWPEAQPELDPPPPPPQIIAADEAPRGPAYTGSSRQEPQWVDEPLQAPRTTPAAAATSPAPQAGHIDAMPAPDDFGHADTVQMDLDSDASVSVSPLASEKLAAAESGAGPSAMPDQMPAAPGQELPSFLRPATTAGRRWSGPWATAALGLLSGLLMVLLGLQLLLHFRDALATQYPQIRPQLQALCAAAGCEIKPWQRIDSISVESSALSQAGSAGHQYKLMVSLRNKSEFELALPWIELSLSDASGGLILRRALSPQDFRIERAVLPADSELPLQLLLSSGERSVSGYSVEIFYP